LGTNFHHCAILGLSRLVFVRQKFKSAAGTGIVFFFFTDDFCFVFSVPSFSLTGPASAASSFIPPNPSPFSNAASAF